MIPLFLAVLLAIALVIQYRLAGSSLQHLI